MKNQNAYQILGVSSSDSLQEIRDAYRKLSQKWHPDINPSPQAQEMFAQISEAYSILSNPVKRAELNAQISTGLIENVNDVVERTVDSYLNNIVKT